MSILSLLASWDLGETGQSDLTQTSLKILESVTFCFLCTLNFSLFTIFCGMSHINPSRNTDFSLLFPPNHQQKSPMPNLCGFMAFIEDIWGWNFLLTCWNHLHPHPNCLSLLVALPSELLWELSIILSLLRQVTPSLRFFPSRKERDRVTFNSTQNFPNKDSFVPKWKFGVNSGDHKMFSTLLHLWYFLTGPIIP